MSDEWDWPALFSRWLEGDMGGLTPRRIAEEWTLGQVAVLILKIAENAPGPDPFRPGPGERVRGKV